MCGTVQWAFTYRPVRCCCRQIGGTVLPKMRPASRRPSCREICLRIPNWQRRTTQKLPLQPKTRSQRWVNFQKSVTSHICVPRLTNSTWYFCFLLSFYLIFVPADFTRIILMLYQYVYHGCCESGSDRASCTCLLKKMFLNPKRGGTWWMGLKHVIN